MHFTTAAAAAAIMAGTASAMRSAVSLNKDCDYNKPHAKVINRCPYNVYLWSVFKGDNCPKDGMVTLKPGDVYAENYEDPNGSPTGISIKMSMVEDCTSKPITQLEYFLQKGSESKQFDFNWLDVSYVDCSTELRGLDCPSRREGYWLQAGTDAARAAKASDHAWCPQMSCWDDCSCGFMSYVGAYDDNRTKSCSQDQNMEFYMCGNEAPGAEGSGSPYEAYSSYNRADIFKQMGDKCGFPSKSTGSDKKSSAAPSSTAQKETAAPKPTETETDDSYGADVKIHAAEVTQAPKIQEVEIKQKTKTEVVYVTAYETVNAKRHAHGHARRHAAYHA